MPVETAERKKVELKWYLCPKCNGLGETPSKEARKGFNGVKTIRHNLCPVCEGRLIIRSATSTSPGGMPLHPVEECGTCHNWYAIGGGKPADEPCYQDHYTLRNSVSHCHWHDKSLPHFVVGLMKAESA